MKYAPAIREPTLPLQSDDYDFKILESVGRRSLAG
jgi:hypothetical protein